jgi:predicted DNA-binding protein
MITPTATLASSSIKAGNDATITFRLPQEKKELLEKLAQEQGVKLSKLINEILDKASK